MKSNKDNSIMAIGYMCSTDFDCELEMELGNGIYPIVFPSVKEIMKQKECCRPAGDKQGYCCDIIKVKIEVIERIKHDKID